MSDTTESTAIETSDDNPCSLIERSLLRILGESGALITTFLLFLFAAEPLMPKSAQSKETRTHFHHLMRPLTYFAVAATMYPVCIAPDGASE
jgi:hypothetical protein